MLRHRLLMIGIIVLAMGIQFRRVESYSLNERVSGVIRDRMAQVQEPMPNPSDPFASWSTASSAMGGKMSRSPPRWRRALLALSPPFSSSCASPLRGHQRNRRGWKSDAGLQCPTMGAMLRYSTSVACVLFHSGRGRERVK